MEIDKNSIIMLEVVSFGYFTEKEEYHTSCDMNHIVTKKSCRYYSASVIAARILHNQMLNMAAKLCGAYGRAYRNAEGLL